MIGSLLREPLLHFAVIGAVLFAVLSRGNTDDEGISREIVVTQGHIENLSLLWQRTWQRPPTQEELKGIVRDYVREEILYREARAMGLDENDSVIRRRLRQKLEFLAEDFAAMAEPDEAQLQAFLDNHLERYAIEPRLSFRQVFVSRDKRGAEASAHIDRLLSLLREDAPGVTPEELGDPLPLPSALNDVAVAEVSRAFGNDFADAVQALPTASWQGPVASAFGEHLVFLSHHQPGRKPELAEVREAVRRDWLAEQQRDTREAFYNSLREQYSVKVEGGTPL